MGGRKKKDDPFAIFIPPSDFKQAAREIVKRGYHELAKVTHPDTQTGSVAAMQVLNAGKEWLDTMMKDFYNNLNPYIR